MENTDQPVKCSICEQRDIPSIGVTWCINCDEVLCDACNQVHKYSRSSSNHKVMSIRDYSGLPHFVASLKERCEKHDEPFKLYCPAHKEPCCCECTSSRHSTCHGFKSLDSLVKNISDKPLLDLECAINELSINLEKVYDNRVSALKTLEEQFKKVCSEIKITRIKLNNLLDSMEKELLERISVLHAEYKDRLENSMSDLMQMKKRLDEIQNNVEDLKNFASSHQMFLGSFLLNSKLDKMEQKFLQLFANENMNILRQKDVSLKFTPGPIDNETNLLGLFEVTEFSAEIPFRKNESLGSELSLCVLQSIETIQMRTIAQFKLYDGLHIRNVAGCAFLDKGQVMFPDWSDNKELLFFNEHGKKIRSMVIDKKAFDVVYIGESCIALTLPDAKQMSVLNFKSRKEICNVSFENRCWGITYIEDNIFVREYSAGIHCLDMDGTILKTLPVSGYITHITSYNGNLYYTEHTPDVVHCCDTDGDEIWQLVIEGKPKGIAVGKFGFVFVVFEEERKLLVISPDGTSFREILNADNGLQIPHAIDYDMQRNKLLLVKDKTGLAEMYDVLY